MNIARCVHHGAWDSDRSDICPQCTKSHNELFAPFRREQIESAPQWNEDDGASGEAEPMESISQPVPSPLRFGTVLHDGEHPQLWYKELPIFGVENWDMPDKRIEEFCAYVQKLNSAPQVELTQSKRTTGSLGTTTPTATADSSRDWPEDFSDENGNYQRRCSTCHNLFIGYKRRLICRLCATADQWEKDLLRATSIGIATIITRCGAYSELSPYMKSRYDELQALHSKCERAFNANIEMADQTSTAQIRPGREEAVAGKPERDSASAAGPATADPCDFPDSTAAIPGTSDFPIAPRVADTPTPRTDAEIVRDFVANTLGYPQGDCIRNCADRVVMEIAAATAKREVCQAEMLTANMRSDALLRCLNTVKCELSLSTEKLEAAEQDAKRLDALERMGREDTAPWFYAGAWELYVNDKEKGRFSNLRAAIDAFLAKGTAT